MPNEHLAIGTKIQFNRELVEPADGEHPPFLLAFDGEEGEIVEVLSNRTYEFSVRTKHLSSSRRPDPPFLVNRTEFDVIVESPQKESIDASD